MSYFKAKMHQIRFRLELRPRPGWGAYSAPPHPLAGYKGVTSKGREGRKDVREGQGRGEGRAGDLLVRRGEEREGREWGKGEESD